MLSQVQTDSRARDPSPAATRDGGPRVLPAVGLFLLISAALFVIGALALTHLPYWKNLYKPDEFGGKPWLDAWAHWDTGWYAGIAERGYWFYDPERQNPAAFFPGYPVAMRIANVVFSNFVISGIAVTVVCGAIVTALFVLWTRHRGMSPTARWTALLLLLLYPYAFYLYGAAYADALFLAGALGAFVLLERNLPWLAGVAGAVASGTRPVGVLILVPLVIRLVEKRGGLRQLRWRDAGILLAGVGIGAYALFCWRRFGSPLAFIEAQRGWEQPAGPATWFKLEFFADFRMFDDTPRDMAIYWAHPILTFAALALVPWVVRRFGWGYASYVLLVVGVSAISTKNFFGMSRYVLAAFPCFAVAGELLARFRRARLIMLGASGVLLVAATSLFARGFYVS